MVIFGLLRAEALLPSVSDTPRPTRSADVADACPSTSRKAPALPVAIPQPDSENVLTPPLRRMVPQDPKP